jgi:hypothetical protein
MSHSINTLRPATRRSGAGHAERTGASDATPPGGSPPRDRALGSPYREHTNWAQAGLFAAGVALGAMLGAGAALLTAPQSGVEARLALKRRARRARVHAEDRWDGLGRELRGAARRRKREVRRKIAASRWRASDAFEG